jgi:mannose-1-phosphate guanylyltransferase / mannose-6-phosphate isomerase
MTRIIPLIMCGGAGTRLWPASRENMPKQFIGLFGERSTFQDTILRVRDRATFDRPIIVSHEAYRSMVVEQLAAIGAEADILLEPCRRDSGPAILAGALHALARRADAIVLALAADHVVKYPDRFRGACFAGLDDVASGRILTFGVRPDGPSSEYGYIQPAGCDGEKPCPIVRFVEKPDRATAERYVAEGYLWNSGNFMFRADVLIDEYRHLDAATVRLVAEATKHRSNRIWQCSSIGCSSNKRRPVRSTVRSWKKHRLAQSLE